MSLHISVPLTPRQNIEYTNHHQALVICPSSIPVTIYETLKTQGYQLYAAGAVGESADVSFPTEYFKDVIPARVEQVVGCLGKFEAFVSIQGKQENLGVFNAGEKNFWDIVIDASSTPFFSQSVSPLGYFSVSQVSPADNTTDHANDLQEKLTLWEGGLTKPVYFQYTPDQCAHFNLDHTGCTRCLDVCPARAITSDKGILNYNPELCQGCGTCTMACPTGAVSYATPKSRDILVELLQGIYECSDQPQNTILRISDEKRSVAESTVELQVPEVLSQGSELWLSALSMGYHAVLIAPQKPLPPESRAALEIQLSLWNTILGDQRIALDFFEHIFDSPIISPLPRDFRSWPSGKQALIHHALDRLLARQEAKSIPLPEGSPIGRIEINPDACSQCLACAQLCPIDALKVEEEGENGTSLWFSPQRCTQCGICEAGCPEDAIQRVPVLETKPEARSVKYKQFDVDMAKCRICGAPFMSQKLLDSISGKLAKDTKVNQALIYTCQSCRVDAFFGFKPQTTDSS